MRKHVFSKGNGYRAEDFIPCVNKVFTYTKWIGIPVFNGKFALFWTLLLLTLFVMLETCAIWKLFSALVYTTSGSSVARLSGSIFYANGLISFILTWKFIIAWKNIFPFWLRADKALELYVTSDKYIKRTVNFVYKFVGVCAFVEHILSMVSATDLDCSPKECFRVYVLRSHGFLVRTNEYNLWIAIPIFILSKIATILWNLQDLVIILISLGLTSRYNRLNKYAMDLILRRNRNKLKVNTLHQQFWRKLREAYVRQASLVRILDKHLGPLILLSNTNNLYFICLQLYLGIRPKITPSRDSLLQSKLSKIGKADFIVFTSTNWISRLYYITSLTWLLLRACSVVLAAAEISVRSRQILPPLRLCSNSAYNIEIKRLINQLTYDKVILSGMGLFSLRRQNLLEVAAAVIKYELILLQYDK